MAAVPKKVIIDTDPGIVKKSTPNANILVKLSEKDGLKPLYFDSLKTLPTAQEVQQSEDAGNYKVKNHEMDLALVTDAAKWLSLVSM